jgi:MHS family alpha-ketoglutarate permease-like MFS transporter
MDTVQYDSPNESAAQVGKRLRAIFGGSIGNLIEWYDFYVYNSFAVYFAKLFTASNDPTVQFITVFGIYAVGFFIRPVGGVLLGYYADRSGRRAALTLSVMLMCIGSLIVAVLPTYAQVGIWAPLLLMGGQVLAALVLLIMQQGFSQAQLGDWGWRIPFFIGALCALYGLYLRRHLPETDDFLRVAKEPRRNLFRELAKHPRELLLVFGLTMGGTTAFYTFSSYMPTYLSNTLKLPPLWVGEISFITLFLFAAMQPLFGFISDLVGRKPVLLWFGILGTLFTVPLLTVLGDTHTYMGALLLVLAALAIVSGYTSINAVVKAELFPAGIRALGVGLPYALAASIFGGTAPLLALEFKSEGHETWFYWYVTLLIFLSLIVYATMRDTKKTSKIVG